MTVRWSALLIGTLLVAPSSLAVAASADVVRDLASRVGPIVGSASACQSIDQGRVQSIVDQFREVIRRASLGDGERDTMIRSFNGYVPDGRNRMAASQIDCPTAQRQLADLTQGVPSVAGYSSLVLDYKAALAKYTAGEAPDTMSLEGYISASILIQALKQTNPLDTERLADTLEAMRSLDLGLGTPLAFGRAEHQASHKIWGTALDEAGNYQAIELE